MNKKIVEYHMFLNKIYEDAEKLFEYLVMLSYKATLNSYNNHYISINGKYENQKYFMPVISIENTGDICFNLDGIEFEFFIDKEKILKLSKLEDLLNEYKSVLHIYEFNDCTIDIYTKEDTKQDLLRKVIDSKETKFGISINCLFYSSKDILNYFNTICSLLEI